ncbi:MAG: fused DSP-PTPase phosphatase/NAD kinase-like protein [Pyrinomonadaceae bacterium]
MITAFSTVFALLLFLLPAAFSQTSPSKDFPNIKIKNFGQMDERFYRGARPKEEDFAALKALGINTIIDLTDDKKYDGSVVEAAGLRYVSLPIPDKSYPTDEILATFLKIIEDKDTGVFYVHCAGGRHRTGNMGALYRFAKYGWDYEKVYKEMKNYDFYSSWGHGKQKDFVIDYAAKMEAQKVNAVAVQ